MEKDKVMDYVIVRRLGEGSFGEVVLAERDGKQFAIKKISKKQIIKVRTSSIRSINYTNPLWKRKYSLDSKKSFPVNPFSCDFMTRNLMMTMSTLCLNSVVEAPSNLSFSVSPHQFRQASVYGRS